MPQNKYACHIAHVYFTGMLHEPTYGFYTSAQITEKRKMKRKKMQVYKSLRDKDESAEDMLGHLRVKAIEYSY